MRSKPDLKTELAAVARIQEPAERSIQIAAIIAEALREIGQDPILVGGAAVEFYTQGGYTTADIDMLAEGGADLVAVMEALGFRRMGKDFIDLKNKIYVEFPGAALQYPEQAVQIQIGNRRLRIIAIEDLIVDRLCAFKWWKSAIDGLNVLKLLEAGNLDGNRVEVQAKEKQVEDALERLRSLQETIIRQKMPPKAANILLEKEIRALSTG